jgi:large subunit ribosomal protein L21
MAFTAVVQTGSKQYTVKAGDVLDVELLDAEAGAQVTLDDVRLVSVDGKVTVGTPTVPGAKVLAEVQEAQRKGPKLVIGKFKAKTHYRRKTGHRQKYTRILIKDVVSG